MGNKTGLITPFLMLLAGSVASIIMYIRNFEFYTMLWVLLIVLLIFYVIGDIARYLYATVRPRVISDIDYAGIEHSMQNSEDEGSVITRDNIDDEMSDGSLDEDKELDLEGFVSDKSAEEASDEENLDEGYSDEILQGFSNDEDEIA